MKKVLRQICLLLSSLAIGGCTTAMTATELQRRMESGTAPLVVDVRSEREYRDGHIPEAVHIPFYSAGSGLEERKHPKGEPLLLYCEHGPRTSLAGISLYFQGYGKVYSLEGNMKGWRDQGLPIAK